MVGGRGGLYYFFLVCKKISFSTFPQQAIFFPFLGGGGGGARGRGVGKGEVLYRLYSSLLFVGFVLCLSFLVCLGRGLRLVVLFDSSRPSRFT